MQTFSFCAIQTRHCPCQTFRHSHTPVPSYDTVDLERDTTSRWLELALFSHLIPERCQGVFERLLVLRNGEETFDQVRVLPGEAVTELRGRRLKRGQVELKDGFKVQHIRLSVIETVGDQMDAWADARFLAMPMPYTVLGDW